MKKISDELSNRILERGKSRDIYEIIGVEIKRRRISSNITLENLAYKICSVSYLCKIEKNKIDPNRRYLKEICSKLELGEDKYNYLYELKEVLDKCIHAYIIGDNKTIKKAYEDGFGFENYRYNLVEFIYYISTKDFYHAGKKYSEILPLVSNMAENDLIIFSILSGIYNYYAKDPVSALDDVKHLSSFTTNEDIKILRSRIVFRCHYALNSSDTLYYYNKCKNDLLDAGYYDQLEYETYIMELYFLKNDCIEAYEENLKYVKNKKLLNSLKFLYCRKKKSIAKALSYSDDKLVDSCLIMKKLFVNKTEAWAILEQRAVDYYQEDFDKNYLTYMFMDEPAEKLNFIYTVVVGEIKSSNDKFLKDFYFNEIVNLPMASGKTRTIYAVYKAFYEGFSVEYITKNCIDIDGELYEMPYALDKSKDR